MTTEMAEDIQRMKQCKGWMQETDNGVAYDWGLAGPGGAWFVLFCESHHTKEDMKQAEHCLKRDRDVVSLEIRKVKLMEGVTSNGSPKDKKNSQEDQA